MMINRLVQTRTNEDFVSTINVAFGEVNARTLSGRAAERGNGRDRDRDRDDRYERNGRDRDRDDY